MRQFYFQLIILREKKLIEMIKSLTLIIRLFVLLERVFVK